MKATRFDGARTRATLFGFILVLGTIAALAFKGTIGTDLGAKVALGPPHSSSGAAEGGPSQAEPGRGGTMIHPTPSGLAPTPGGGGGSSVGLSLAEAGIARTPGTTASAGAALRRFSPLYMSSGNFSQAQAVTLAHNFDVIAEHAGVLTPYIGAMKAANPSLKIVAYMNGAFDNSNAGNSYPASWYAHDSKGSRIKSVGFANWLMDPTVAAWSGSVASQCGSLIAKSKYDGCFLDTLGLGPLMPGYVTGLPIDPSTHQAYTPAAWIKAQCNTIAAAKRANGNAVIIANGLASGAKYFAGSGTSTSPLLAASGMAMSELWLRVSGNSANSWPSVTSWLQDINMLVNAESHGWSVMTTTKLWTSASASQQLAWHNFTLASFLLGAGGHCAYSFSAAQTSAGLSATYPSDTSQLGTPTGALTVSGGLYHRSFTNGVVVVNPGSQSVTVTLPGAFTNSAGARVTSETLPPHSGDVLVG